MADATCSIEDCERSLARRGYCQRHYLRWWRHGDPLAGGKFREHEIVTGQKPCTVARCGLPLLARGWCSKHYQRWKLTGNPLGSNRKPKQTGCTVEGCERPFLARGYCVLHYGRWKNHGATDAPRAWWKNVYEPVDLLVTYLVLTSPTGKRHDVLIDTSDAVLAQSHQWSMNPGGYAVTHVGSRADNFALPLHRLILGLSRGDGRVGDHVNGDRTDNRRANLRIADHKLNAANQAILNRRGSSEYRGVCWDKSREKWKAYTRVNGKMHNLGYFITEREAADVVIAYRAVHHVDSGYLRRHDHTPTTGRAS